MNNIKYILIAILVIFTACKPSKYPDLKEGLYADIQTEIGDVLIELYFQKTPMTVANFVSLAEGNHPKVIDSLQNKPFYNNTTFHRVVDNLLIQTGKPNYTENKGIGYFFGNELRDDLKHNEPGVVSMSNLGKVYSNSSQFFITKKEAPWLDGYNKSGELKPCGKYGTACHTVFGKVVKGLNLIDSIQLNSKINSIDIIRVGDKAEDFNAPETFLELSEKSIPFKIKMGIDSTKQTISGLKYLKLNTTSGKKVHPALKTQAHYKLYNSNGKLLASSYKRNKPIVFTINNDALIAGWKEGAKLLREGERARLFIPSYLGYGTIGSPIENNKQLVKPNEDLIFEIEILKVGK